MCLFVHMTNTTSQDGGANIPTVRNVLSVEWSSRNTIRVMTHVVIYPLGLPCIGGVATEKYMQV